VIYLCLFVLVFITRNRISVVCSASFYCLSGTAVQTNWWNSPKKFIYLNRCS